MEAIMFEHGIEKRFRRHKYPFHLGIKMALTDKQDIFCREYLIDLNATQAAIRAGYSAKTANRTASENMSKPDI